MVKKLCLLALTALIFAQSAHATLSNGTAVKRGNSEYYSAYVTATSNDTTDPANGSVIYNSDNSVESISASILATNKTGTSPTVALQLIGSNDGTNFFVVQSSQATPANIATSALDISSADTTNVVGGWDTVQFQRPRGGFPTFLKLRVDIGGSSTPGWTGVVSARVDRARRGDRR